MAAARLHAAAAQTPPLTIRTERPARLAPGSPSLPGPDLLHHDASVSVDHDRLKRALSFAFAAGDATGSIRAALTHAAVAPSKWKPESFETDIFLEALVEGAAAFEVNGRPAPVDRTRLRALLAHPPSDSAHVQFRQQIVRELAESGELRAAMTHAYGHVAELIELLDEEGGDSRLDMTRFRLDVLTKVRDTFASLDEPFAGAQSGLQRLHLFSSHVRAIPAYRDLTDLLHFEQDMARVDLQLRLGADGRVRSIDVMRQRESKIAPYYRAPWSRFWRRLSAWLRGYRIGESVLVESWLDGLFGGIAHYLPFVVQLKGDLEFYLASLHLHAQAAARGLVMSLPEIIGDDAVDGRRTTGKALTGLFNPLLLRAESPAIPCDIRTPAFAHTMILTGPNSGGKTRLLQALAFTQLLGQCGLFVPARSATLRHATGLFVSLGETTSADQKEGRLGMELLRIRRVFEEAHQGALIILDELCSGTNPSEGEEIFQMVLELLKALRPEVYITTHFLSLARKLADADASDDLSFLQVGLDDDEHPTYQFVPGVARTSLAGQMAARLGVTREQLLALIARGTDPKSAPDLS